MLKRDKKANITRILHILWTHKEISRVQIARLTGLDKSTVTKIVNELIDLGLIMVVAEGDAGPQGGRKPVLLRITPEFGVVMGIEIQPDFCRISAVDLSGKILNSQKVKASIPSEIKTLVSNTIIPFAENLEKKGLKVLGAGIGVPGIVDPFNSEIKQSIPFGLKSSMSIKSFFSDWKWGPVIIENDANCCAWGELAFWRQENIRDFLTVLIELNDDNDRINLDHWIAVGFGIVIDGKVHLGKNYSSGEFRSLLWESDGCSQFSFTKEQILQFRNDKDIRLEFQKELASHLAFLVNMFNLSHVFLGGDTELFKDQLPDIVGKALNYNWPYHDNVDCDIHFLSQGSNAVSFGAAGLILNSIFSEDIMRSHGEEELPSGIDFLSTANDHFGG